MADNEVQIDSLSVAIEHSAGTASKDLSSLASSLKKLQTSVSALNMWDAVRQFDALGAAAGSLTYFSTALDSLRNAKISSSIGRQLKEIGDAANSLGTLDTAALDKVKALGESLKPLGELGRAQLTSFINQLAKLPALSASLDTVDMEHFAATVERLTAAMAPLATEMDKIARGFSAFPQRIQTFIKNNEAATSSVKKSKKEMGGWQDTLGKILGRLEKIENKPSLFEKLLSISVLKQAGQFLKSDLESANEYIEALNLFYVSMGGYAEKAQQYAEIVGDSYGIDPGEFMRMQAIFMDISKSFGATSGTAYTMSKALAQLTYDISSLYNLKIDEALNKTRSALVGEIEPIRALGKDLSVANLKLLATELGVTANVDAMNQSEKAMLRTISLLRQSNSAMGDMARTLEQPANQFRILKAQLTLLGRAIGDLFLPLVQKTLPYMIAFVKVGQRIVSAFAALAGFELPKFDYADSVIKGNEGVADSADDAAKSMKKLYQLSFDELNILGSQNTGASGSGTSAADLAKLEAELNRLAKIEDDMFSKNLGETTDKIAAQIENWLTKGEGIKSWASDVWGKFEGIKTSLGYIVNYADDFGAMIGLWKVDDDLVTKLRNIGVALLVIAGAKTAIKIGTEIVKVGQFIKKLFGLEDATKSVTDAMGEKNKKLTEQTKETAEETEAVGELSPALDTATSAITAMAGAIPAIGLNWDTAWQFVSSNPIVLNVDASQIATAGEKVSEFVNSSFYQLNSWLVGSADAMSTWQATLNALTGETTSSLNSAWKSAFDGLNTDTVNGFNDILTSSDSFGETIFSSMVNPIQRVDSEYAATFNNIYSNYARLMGIMGATVPSYSASGRAGGTYSSGGRRVTSSRKNANQMVAFGDDGSGAYRGKRSDPEFERVWNEVTGNSSKSATFAKSIEYILEKTLKLLKGMLGAASSAIGAPAFATGGFPEDGMFYANSGELVGRFANGRTAVANNAQIIEGIENAVYRAMTAAQRGSGRGGKIELILDKQVVGRAFGDAIDSEKRRSGANTKITFTNGGTR